MRIFWGKWVTTREGGAEDEGKNTVICTGKEKAADRRDKFFVDMMAVVPNLSSLRFATGNIVLSLLSQRTNSADADWLKLLFH